MLFQLKGRTFGLTGIDTRDQSVAHLARHVSTQLGLEAPGMHRRRPHPTRFVPPIELDRKQRIRGL
jgi:hypothetical protein